MDELQRLLIERACERLAVDYSRRVDAREESFVDLFTEDAVLNLAGHAMRGHGEIINVIRHGADEIRIRRHLCLTISVDVISPDEARGMVEIIYFTGPSGVDAPVRMQQLEPQAVGTYHDVYRRTEAGWRIAERRIKPAFVRAGDPG